ncbi:MAG: hypothetical protein J7641_20385 [Cyanobacteria bacterium SID2]|nr:hypothetical protein [Cyanobacteria bacterium SID2]MBP0003529.1 hypothetical protein [Cyanobacteria bacterium SBC]
MNLTVLIIENIEHYGLTECDLKRLAAGENCNVISAIGMSLGLHLVRHVKPHAILSDIDLPPLTGYKPYQLDLNPDDLTARLDRLPFALVSSTMELESCQLVIRLNEQLQLQSQATREDEDETEERLEDSISKRSSVSPFPRFRSADAKLKQRV